MGESLKIGTKEIAAIAVMGALTTVATMTIQVPFPATGGYFNLGDTVVVATALLLFGPIIGAIARAQIFSEDGCYSSSPRP